VTSYLVISLVVGFISIDCGATNGTSYQDRTGITYVSDYSYVDTGKNYNISKDYTSPSNQSSTLRSFPNEKRNCYTINVTKGDNYLLRATFLYGNYDGNKTAQASTPLQFNLHLYTTFWRTVNITDASKEYAYEILTAAWREYIWLCLVDINAGTPFISALELRPLKNNLYNLYDSYYSAYAILFRLNYGPTRDTVVRYKLPF
jgi:Malectin-like domain